MVVSALKGLTPSALLIVLLFPFFGCGDQSSETGALTEVDSAGVMIRQTTATQPEIFRTIPPEPAVVIGRRDGPPEYTMGRVRDGLFLSDGRIAVTDGFASSIKVYGPDGTFLDEWGGPGSGPGEFGVLWSLDRYRGDSLIVAESGARRLSILSDEGEFGRLVQPQIRVSTSPGFFSTEPCCEVWGSMISGEFLISYSEQIPVGGAEPRWGEVPLMAFDPDGGRSRSLGRFPSGEYRRAGLDSRRPSIGLQINTSMVVAPHPRGFVELNGTDHSIRFHNTDGALEIIGRVQKPRTPMTEEIRGAYEDLYETMVSNSGYPPEDTGLDVVINRPYPDSLPAYPWCFVDEIGNVWAGGEWPSPIDLLGHFDVFSGDGTYLGQVALPRRMRVLDVTSTRILALLLDELDVPYVLVYEVLRP